MEIRGFEPLTSSLQSWRSSQLSYIPVLVLPMASVLPLANFKSQTGNYQSALLQNINRITRCYIQKKVGGEKKGKMLAHFACKTPARFTLYVWSFGACSPVCFLYMEFAQQTPKAKPSANFCWPGFAPFQSERR